MTDARLTFAAYAGSLRKGSYNRMLLQALEGVAPPEIGIEWLELHDVPIFNADLERDPPPSVKRIREQIRAADGLIIVSPEHNGIVPAVTKNVIEWASRPPEGSVLNGKPVGLLGASTSGFGTIKAQVVIRQIAIAEGVYFLQKPQIRVARAQTKFDENGELTDDDLRRQLREFLTALAAWTRKINA